MIGILRVNPFHARCYTESTGFLDAFSVHCLVHSSTLQPTLLLNQAYSGLDNNQTYWYLRERSHHEESEYVVFVSIQCSLDIARTGSGRKGVDKTEI